MSDPWPEHFAPQVVGLSHGSSPLSSISIALEGWRRGLDVTFSAPSFQHFSVSDGLRTVKFNYSRPGSITRESHYSLLDHKSETNSLLRKKCIPVPEGVPISPQQVDDVELRRIAERLGFPLVIKPDKGSFGRGVFAGLADWYELKEAYLELVRQHRPHRIVLEKHYEGADHRLLVVGGQVVGAARRVPAHVIGDGLSSIDQLIEAKNTSRKQNPFLKSGLIKIDYEVRKCLRDQDFALESVPPLGSKVQLRRVANASAGGDVIDVTDELPEKVKNAAIAAVGVLPSVLVAGVDVLYKSGSSTDEETYVVIEVNSRPHIGVNMYPSSGQGRDVPRAILDTVFPGTARPTGKEVVSLRFNAEAVRSALGAGVASQITLPRLPPHLYPHRRKVTFTSQIAHRRFERKARASLRRLALSHNVSGRVRRTRNGEVELFLAARNRNAAQPIVQRVAETLELTQWVEAPWEGPVTAGFNIIV